MVKKLRSKNRDDQKKEQQTEGGGREQQQGKNIQERHHFKFSKLFNYKS